MGESRVYMVGAIRGAWRELAEMLKTVGYPPVMIGNCRDGFQAIQDDLGVDLVLIDADSAEGCGIPLARRMQAIPRVSTIPIIVAGASINQESVQQFLSLRVKDIVLLPANPDTLKAKIDRAIRAGRCSVLVVDDESGIRQILTEMLEMERFRVHAVASAKEALEVLQKNHVDIVVSDIMMPGMDGIQLMKTIKASSHDVPVVLVTGNSGRHGPETALAAGADGYFVKPFNRMELVYTLNRLLSSRTRPAQSIATPPQPTADRVDLTIAPR